MSVWLGETIISFVFIIMGVVFYIGSSGFSKSVNPLDIGPAAFPRLMITFMILAAVAQIILSYMKHRKNKDGTEEKLAVDNRILLIIAIGVLAAYALLMPITGYYVITPIFIFSIMFLMGNRKWVQMLLVSAGFTLFAYFVFFKFLKVLLP